VCEAASPTRGARTGAGRRRLVRAAAPVAFGVPQQSGTFVGQACAGMPDLHPGRVTELIAALRFLIGEPSQAAQVTPVGARPVTAVGVGQLFADAVGHRGFDGGGTDVHSSLEIVGTGLEYHTGPVPVGPHGFDDGWAGLVQVDEDGGPHDRWECAVSPPWRVLKVERQIQLVPLKLLI
jgi:hypothetical protein